MNMNQFYSSSTFPSPSSAKYYSVSQSPFEDLARCNQHKFWRSVTRGLKKYLTCFKRMKSRGQNAKIWGESSVGCSHDSSICYSEMDDEERAKKLRALVEYCKSTIELKVDDKQTCETQSTETTHDHKGAL